jgi:hypothetical protein
MLGLRGPKHFPEVKETQVLAKVGRSWQAQVARKNADKVRKNKPVFQQINSLMVPGVSISDRQGVLGLARGDAVRAGRKALVNLGVRELDRQYKIDVKRIKVQREEIKAILKHLRKYTYTPSGSRNVRFCINLSRQQLYELYRREFPEILLDLWNRMKGKPQT